jgi:RND superfamily putative drug exporter
VERWTHLVLRFRWPILVAWAVVVVVGGWSSTRVSALLSNTFTVPGTDSERARNILRDHFGDRSDGSFLLVFRVDDASDPAARARVQAAARSAARLVPTARAQRLAPGGPHILYGNIVSTLGLADAKSYTDELLRALPHSRGVESYVSGQAAIAHDLDPIFSQDLRKGESIALPIAFLVLLAVFGLSFATTMPFLFAAATIMGTLAIVYGIAHLLVMPTYVTNLVQLIGLGIAIDYSLLVVYRFREELTRHDSVEHAIARTMATAGRAVIFSGATVAIGLALLLFMPVPFMRAMGVGGFLIPCVSLLAAATLQPALLSLYGRRGTARIPLLPRRFRAETQTGFWHRLAGAIMRRPLVFLAVGAGILVAAAVPVYALQLTPGSAQGIPQTPQSVRGLNLLRAAVGPGALSPTQIVGDAGPGRSVHAPRVQAAITTLADRLRRDPEVARVSAAPAPPFVDASGRYEQIVVAGHHEYGEQAAQSFVHRLRGRLIPGSGFPEGTRVLAGGGPPQGVDFIDQAYTWFPWLVLGVLALTYLLLMRAFRSFVLPLKAVILNLLSVAASYGMLVIVFHWGVGRHLVGVYQFDQVEAWIPIFLFAMLFGLSMDYEVFLVTRMREEWDGGRDNARAVAYGLERTGRIVTAAAVVMVAAFAGFVAGRIVGLQEVGLGLAVAIFVDATIVRALLVPSLMAIMGRYNWWLPDRLARVVRVQPSPLKGPQRPALRPAGR